MKKRTNKTGDASIYFLLAMALILAAGGFFTIRILRSDPIEEALAKKNVINILFILEGSSSESRSEKPLGSYVMMYSPGNNRAAAVSVPGDVGRILSTVDRMDRIDSVYQPKNSAAFISELEDLLELKIDYSLIFESEKLGKIVDLVEGVELFIPQTTEIYDESPILFPSGNMILDGDKARQYIGYEVSAEDISQAYLRRDRFFLGFLKSLGENNVFLRSSGTVFYPFIKTNMTRLTCEKLFAALAALDISRVSIQPVAGNYREISGKQLLFPYFNGTVIKDIVRQARNSLSQDQPGALVERVFTVEILNGTIITGLASRTAELIRGFRYEIVHTGNADRNDHERTEIIDRTGLEDAIGVFAEIIHCKNIRYEETGETIPLSSRADFTLIIGRDFNGRVVTGN